MADRYLLEEGIVLDADSIRLWAYDEDIFMIQQDEDLVLAHWDFVPILLALACEPDCPKADYAYQIADWHARWLIIHQEPHDLVKARDAVAWARQQSAKMILDWADLQSRRLEVIANPAAATDEQFMAIGELLLDKPAMEKRLERVGPSLGIVHARHGSYREALLIDAARKKVRFSRYFPDGVNPKWYEPKG